MFILKRLIESGQNHIVAHYEKLQRTSPIEAAAFLEQIENIDFDLMDRLFHELVEVPTQNETNNLDPSTSAPALSPLKPDILTVEQELAYGELGLKAIKNGEVAVLLLAGGQGSRLGHDGPKGTFSIGLPGDPSLFELQAKALLEVVKRADVHIPWYIMTSATNREQTELFFKDHNYFGYASDQVFFFNQGMMPAIDFEGKLLMSARGQLALSPNGNGGCFIALKQEGILDKLKGQGVKWLFLYGVDNAIVNIADPVFIGYTIGSKKPAASKVVRKNNSDEKVGVLCYVNDRPAIVEYSEMDPVLTQMTDDEGRLVYSNGNILNHLLEINTLCRYMDLPPSFHLATKKIPYIDEQDQLIWPNEPNGYKFESFIFDLFPAFEDMAALEVQRHLEFAPVKNATGEDSPQTARDLYLSKFNSK